MEGDLLRCTRLQVHFGVCFEFVGGFEDRGGLVVDIHLDDLGTGDCTGIGDGQRQVDTVVCGDGLLV